MMRFRSLSTAATARSLARAARTMRTPKNGVRMARATGASLTRAAVAPARRLVGSASALPRCRGNADLAT
eukprot:10512089-Lingulodinium_polyedra.AAC.1